MEYRIKNYLFCARASGKSPSRIRFFEWHLYSSSCNNFNLYFEEQDIVKAKVFNLFSFYNEVRTNFLVLSTIEKWQKIWRFR